MNGIVRVMAVTLSHLLILAICVSVALILSGRAIRTETTIDGVNILQLGTQKTVDAVVSGKKQLVSTTYVRAGGRIFSLDGNWGLALLAGIVFVELLVVYLPGVFFTVARHPFAQVAIAGTIFAIVWVFLYA